MSRGDPRIAILPVGLVGDAAVDPERRDGIREQGGYAVDQVVLTAFAGDPAEIRDEVLRLGDAFVGLAAEM